MKQFVCEAVGGTCRRKLLTDTPTNHSQVMEGRNKNFRNFSEVQAFITWLGSSGMLNYRNQQSIFCMFGHLGLERVNLSFSFPADGDGKCELVVGYTDRVVRAFRWEDSSENSDHVSGQLILLKKWLLEGQVGKKDVQSSICHTVFKRWLFREKKHRISVL